MADATMYDPKNVSGITTLYVTNAQTDPIYKLPYPDEKSVLALMVSQLGLVTPLVQPLLQVVMDLVLKLL